MNGISITRVVNARGLSNTSVLTVGKVNFSLIHVIIYKEDFKKKLNNLYFI